MKNLIFTVALASVLGVVAAPPPNGPQPGKPGFQKSVARPAPQAARPQPKPIAKPHPKPIAKPQPKPVVKPHPKPIAKPQPKPMPPAHRPPAHRPPNRIEQSHHKWGMRGAGTFGPPPRHDGFHAHRPHGARFWNRPPLPPRMAGALQAWYWVAQPWNYIVDGVYYYGEGYYFDGYNYCYNGGYHLTPPPVVVTTPVVTQPVVTQPVVTQPVVTQPVVTQPVVTQPVVAPPPPPRRGGLLNVLFGW